MILQVLGDRKHPHFNGPPIPDGRYLPCFPGFWAFQPTKIERELGLKVEKSDHVDIFSANSGIVWSFFFLNALCKVSNNSTHDFK